MGRAPKPDLVRFLGLALFADAEGGEDSPEDVVGGDVAGELREVIEGQAHGRGDQLRVRQVAEATADPLFLPLFLRPKRRFSKVDGFDEALPCGAHGCFRSGAQSQNIGGEADRATGEALRDQRPQLTETRSGDGADCEAASGDLWVEIALGADEQFVVVARSRKRLIHGETMQDQFGAVDGLVCR